MYVAFLLAADLFDLATHLRIVGLGGYGGVVVGRLLLPVEHSVELFG